MKNNKLAFIAAAVATTLSVNAASYTVTNSAGSSLTNSVVNSSGAALTNGIALVGYYSSDRDAQLSVATTSAEILSGFTTFGSGSIGTAGNGIVGLFSVGATTPDLSAAGNPVSGKNIYVIFGNAATLDASTEVAILKLNEVYASAEPTTTSSAVTGKPGTMVKGNWGSFKGDPNPTNATVVTDTSFYSTVPLVVIPEPSALALAGLGALGLLRRRR